MKRNWTEEELVERWTLFPDELALLPNKTGHTRLGFAVMLRFFAGEGRFPHDKHEISGRVLRSCSSLLGSNVRWRNLSLERVQSGRLLHSRQSLLENLTTMSALPGFACIHDWLGCYVK